MIRSIYRSSDGQLLEDLQPEDWFRVRQEGQGVLWVDLNGEPASACQGILRDTFGFHPLAVEDALEEAHVPKVDDWGSYVYLVLHGVNVLQGPDIELETLELDLFLGGNYVVTHHQQPIPAVERTWTACHRDERHLKRGATHLLYKVGDELVAGYMPVVDNLDEMIDLMEDQIFDNPTSHLLARIFALKRALLNLRRIIMPQREVMSKLGRGDFPVIEAGERIFFRDIYDQLVRLHDITESMRDLTSGALDTYLSVVSNRLNETMRTLTLITTLFMPLSFVASFFGMNFFGPVGRFDAWTTRGAFAAAMAVMVLMPLAMYTWLRRRTWM